MGPLLDYLEKIIPASGFLVEDRLTLADIAVASPFVNLSHCEVEVSVGDHPKLAAYLAKILSRPSFAPMIAQERRCWPADHRWRRGLIPSPQTRFRR